MATLDWIVGIIYIVGIVYLGIRIGNSTKNTKDYFTGGKSFAWWAIGASIIATQVSAVTIVGAPGWAYSSGLTPIVLNLNVPIVMWFVAANLVPFFYNTGAVSIYEYLEGRFGYTTRATLAGVFIIKILFIYGGIILAPALVLGKVLDISTVNAILILSTFAVFYTILGGLKAVIWTDVIQVVIMWSGLAVSLYVIFQQSPYSATELLAKASEAGKLNAINFSTDFTAANTFWGGMIGCLVLHVAYFGTDQAQVQRMLAAKDIRSLKLALWTSSYIVVFHMVLFLLMGSLLYVFYEGKTFENGNDVYLSFLDYLPAGFLGLIVCSIFAAGMSTIDSAINSLSTVYVQDFHERIINPKITEEQKLRVAKICTFVFGIIICGSAIVISIYEKASLLEALTKYGSFLTGSILAVFMLAIYTKNATGTGTIIGFFVGIAAVAVVSLNTDVFWMWYSAVGLIVSYAVGYIASLFVGQNPENIEKYTLQGQKAYYQNSNFQEKEGNFHVMPGKYERNSYFLLVYVVVVTILLYQL